MVLIFKELTYTFSRTSILPYSLQNPPYTTETSKIKTTYYSLLDSADYSYPSNRPLLLSPAAVKDYQLCKFGS